MKVVTFSFCGRRSLKKALRIFPYERFLMHACPVSLQRVDSYEVRAISLLVAVSAWLYVINDHAIVFAWMLLFDFTMRIGRRANVSPLAVLAKMGVVALHLKPKYTDERPKRFALTLGALMVALLVVSGSLGWYAVANLTAYVLIGCALLEALFDFCIGCRIYYLLKLLKVI